jgi:hypothetical protein
MENSNHKWRYLWENHLFLWAIYTTAMLNNQRLYTYPPTIHAFSEVNSGGESSSGGKTIENRRKNGMAFNPKKKRS